jgi:predicted phosphoadenosine phosphosulfate sulfurtransferase
MRQKIEKYIKEWENKCYKSGIPDVAPYELEKNCNVPSYKKIAFAILKNDFNLKSLGLTQNNKSIVYNELKRKELIENGKLKIIQLDLFRSK